MKAENRTSRVGGFPGLRARGLGGSPAFRLSGVFAFLFFGVPNLLADAAAERRLEFARLPSHWAALCSIVVLAAMLYAVIWFYRREARTGASLRARTAMAVVRCLILVILAAIWVQPIVATYLHRTINSYTLVLLDGSASMQLADRYHDPAAAARVQRFLASGGEAAATSRPAGGQRRDELQGLLLARGDGQWLKALATRNRVQLWQYGDEPARLGTYDRSAGEIPAATSRPTMQPGAPVTDLGRCLRQAIEGLGTSPVAGVVVLGDGGLNYGESADTIARYARSRNVPVFAVGIGDPSPAQNVRVSEVVAPANAFVKDPFTITVHLTAQGLSGGTLPVELAEVSNGGDRVVATETATVGPDARVEPVSFRRQVDDARTVTYVVRVPPLPAESVPDDNSRQVTVRILESRMRVLLIAGSPTWDYQFVERLLERDKSVDVSCWLQSADVDAVREGTTVITEFPHRPEQLFQYDVVVLFDPQPRDFDPAWGELAQGLVSNNGAGLLYAAGRKYTSRFMNDANCRGVVEMLPVTVDPEAEIVLNQLGYFQAQPWPVTIPPAVLDHPVLAQADSPAATADVWKRLAGVYWHYPVRREKPLATALMRHSNPRMANAYGEHVLLATQFFGAGRTGFLAFDSTWRWRRYGEAYFNRFWIQLLRHLMEGKLLGGGRRGVLMTDRDSFSVGEPVPLGARLLNENHLPLEATEVGVTASSEDGTETAIPLQAEAGRPGWFRGRFIPSRVGRVQFRVNLPAAPGAPGEAITHSIQIVRPNLETLRPQMDREKLVSLAEQSAGGRYFDIDEADAIPDLIEDRNASLVITGTPILLADRYRWHLLAMLLGLLAIEWILRKQSRLL